MTENQSDRAMRLMKDNSVKSNSKAYAMIVKSLAEMREERIKKGIKTESWLERVIRIFLKDSKLLG